MSEKEDIISALSSEKKGNQIVALLALFVMIIPWLGGMVLASPGWLKVFAIFFPPYSWYLFTQRLMQMFGMVA